MEKLIRELLDRIESPEVRGLIRALAVYTLDEQHAFDVTARAQAESAMEAMARYAGVEVN